jgi:hypothetical protein
LVVLVACSKKPTPTSGAPTSSSTAISAAASIASGLTSPAERFTCWAKGASGARLFDLGGIALLGYRRILYSMDERGLHQDLALQRGFPGRVPYVRPGGDETFEVMGRWPDAAWLQAHLIPDAATGRESTALWRRVGERWVQVKVAEPGEVVLGVSGWSGKTALMLLGSAEGVRLRLANDRGNLLVTPTLTAYGEEKKRSAEALLAAADGGTAPSPSASAPPLVPRMPSGLVPSASAAAVAASPQDAALADRAASALTAPLAGPLDAGESDAGAARCVTRLRASLVPGKGALLALPSGEVFIAGTDCTEGDSSLLVERLVYERGKARSSIMTVARIGDENWTPPADKEPRKLGLGGRDARDVWLGEIGGRLFHYDGEAWKESALPSIQGMSLEQLTVSEQGTLWIVMRANGGGEGAVFKRGQGRSSWDRVSLPIELRGPESLVAPSDPRVWILASNGELWSTLSVPLAAPLRLPDPIEQEDDRRHLKLPRPDIERWPMSAVCSSPYVLILEKVKPGKKEFLEVVEKVRPFAGVKLVTEASARFTYLGAIAPNVEVARRIVEAVRSLPEAAPRAFCHAPRVVREIDVNDRPDL